jgi:hypothetical protein
MRLLVPASHVLDEARISILLSQENGRGWDLVEASGVGEVMPFIDLLVGEE